MLPHNTKKLELSLVKEIKMLALHHIVARFLLHLCCRRHMTNINALPQKATIIMIIKR